MYGLLGKKLGHSFSKIIHEEFTKKKYELIETSDLDQFFKTANIDGINVTIPYKNDVIPYLDKLSTEASEIGAVNTIISKNGKLLGYNTDYFGLAKTCEIFNIDVTNKTVIILGNGSTSRTIKYYCQKNLAKKIVVLARNPKENEYKFSDVDKYKNAEIIFNSTPVGMFPNNDMDILIDIKKLPKLISVVDVVYNPLRSNLLIEAESLGKTTVNGLFMLIYQALKSIELFHNIEISDQKALEYYHNLQLSKSNLVFIGMPMSGKTFYSKLISKKYNKTLIDTDKEIEREANDNIPNIFKNHGEKYFRTLESKIISKYSKLNNQAISSGGGVILNKKNMDYLKHNGIIIFIDISLDLLKRCNPKGRPLLQNKDNLVKLYNERYQLYKDYADIIINKTTFNEKDLIRQIEVKLDEYISTKWT